jgi:hypothetical protein
MRDVVEMRRWWRDRVVLRRRVGIGLMLPLAQRWILMLVLLMKDVDVVM